MKHFTATEAKNRFGELMEQINDGPVAIVKNGREVAVIQSKKVYDAVGTKLSKKELIRRIHEDSMVKYSEVYEALAK